MVVESISQPTEAGSRGSIFTDRDINVYLALPGNSDSSLDIMRASKEDNYATFTSVWRKDGFDGEPLVDFQRLETSDTISLFTRTNKDENGERKVVVLDFILSDEPK
jgi:hypothetical protein